MGTALQSRLWLLCGEWREVAKLGMNSPFGGNISKDRCEGPRGGPGTHIHVLHPMSALVGIMFLGIIP